MANYDAQYPADSEYVSSIPKAMRDKLEQVRADTDPIVAGAIVNAKKLQGYLPSNLSGSIPISNGTLNANLNAQYLNGIPSTGFTLISHVGSKGTSVHSVADGTNAGFMPNTHFTKVADILATPTKYENFFNFGNIQVTGSNNVVADAYADYLTLTGSTYLSIVSDSATDSITFDLVKDGSGNALHPHVIANGSQSGFINSTMYNNYQSAFSHTTTNSYHHNFGNITVGGTTLVADTFQDNLTINAGTGITLSGDSTNDAFSIAITQDGHYHSLATAGSNGFMSATHVFQLGTAVTHYGTNHNSFGNFLVGSTNISSDTMGDTLTLIAGTGMSLTPDASNDTITFAVSNVNATYLQGQQVGNESNKIPFSNGNLNVNLNAQMLSGLGVGSFMMADGSSLMSGKLQLNRGNAINTGISFYSPSFTTWIDYMSNPTAGTCPNGSTPSTIGSITGWARRSLVENPANYGWIWESGVNGSSASPVAMMGLDANNGGLFVYGGVTSAWVTATTATGNAPFAINSTTKVPNLNVDMLDGLHDTAFMKVDGSQAMAGNLIMSPVSGLGLGFWGNTPTADYGVYMSQSDIGIGGRISTETTSSYNMYFKMESVGFGFNFKNSSGVVACIDGLGSVHARNGFRTNKFSMQYNATEDSLDFCYY